MIHTADHYESRHQNRLCKTTPTCCTVITFCCRGSGRQKYGETVEVRKKQQTKLPVRRLASVQMVQGECLLITSPGTHSERWRVAGQWQIDSFVLTTLSTKTVAYVLWLCFMLMHMVPLVCSVNSSPYKWIFCIKINELEVRSCLVCNFTVVVHSHCNMALFIGRWGQLFQKERPKTESILLYAKWKTDKVRDFLVNIVDH